MHNNDLGNQKMDWNTMSSQLNKLCFYNGETQMWNFTQSDDYKYYDFAFRHTYAYAPMVSVIPKSASTQITNISISDLTTSGCRVWCKVPSGSTEIIRINVLGILP